MRDTILYWRLCKIEMLTIAILLAINLIFLAMIIAGFIRLKKPESGWLIIAGFFGLATSVLFSEWSSFAFMDLVRDGILSFDSYLKIMDLLMTFGGLLPVIIIFILFLVGFVHRAHPWSKAFMFSGCAGTLIALVVVGVTASSWMKAPGKAAEAEVKANAHTFKIALERYAIDYGGGLYPDRIEMLSDDGYLTDFPDNPFTGQPMKNVPYGSHEFEGNFTYLPVKSDEKITGYYLLAYGYKTTTGECLLDPDVNDHVIIVLSSGSENLLLGVEDNPFLSVQDAILSSQQ
jgi:hypothetical protein